MCSLVAVVVGGRGFVLLLIVWVWSFLSRNSKKVTMVY